MQTQCRLSLAKRTAHLLLKYSAAHKGALKEHDRACRTLLNHTGCAQRDRLRGLSHHLGNAQYAGGQGVKEAGRVQDWPKSLAVSEVHCAIGSNVQVVGIANGNIVG